MLQDEHYFTKSASTQRRTSVLKLGKSAPTSAAAAPRRAAARQTPHPLLKYFHGRGRHGRYAQKKTYFVLHVLHFERKKTKEEEEETFSNSYPDL